MKPSLRVMVWGAGSVALVILAGSFVDPWLGLSFPYATLLIAVVLTGRFAALGSDLTRFDQLRRFVEEAPGATAMLDREMRYICTSRRFREDLGLGELQLKGRSHYEVLPELPEDWKAVHRRCLAGATERHEEAPLVRPDGTTMWLSREIRPWYAAANEIGGVILFSEDRTAHHRALERLLHDATERKKLEDQLRQAQKMEAFGQLAGGVAHDFNNLLSVILSNTGFLIEDLLPGDATRESLIEIRDASERAATLTRQLLAFSRRQVLEPTVLDLNDVLTRIEKMLRRIIGEDIQLVSSLDPGIALVEVDPGQIEQVVMNLAVNARDAMPDGGKLSIETCNVVLGDEPGLRQGRYVRIRVVDTGTGIDPEIRSRIFEPFFTTKGVGRGTGLGLATVLGIVEQSGGRISVESELGAGTAFVIDFPAVDAVVATVKERVIHAAPEGSETILLVEDEGVLRRVVRRILARLGYRVLEAANGAEALSILREQREPIDLVLTDVVMPEMSGPQLVQQMRAGGHQLRVLFMSGYTADALARDGSFGDEEEFLHKPITPDRLASKVRSLLDR